MVIFIHINILTTVFVLTHVLCLVYTIRNLLQMMFGIYQTFIPYRENIKVMVHIYDGEFVHFLSCLKESTVGDSFSLAYFFYTFHN